MITIDDLKAAIAECQGERNPNANTCMKLAAYYIILHEQQGESILNNNYSFQAPALDINPNRSVVYQSGTEFGRTIQGKDAGSIFGLIDELMTVIQAIQPRLYDGVLRKLKEI